MKKRRWALILAVLFTFVTGAITVFSLAAIATAFYYRPTIEATGSGGIGAVSVGIAEMLVETLPLFILAIIVNRSVAAPARQCGPGTVWIRRGHLAWIVLTMFWPVAVMLLVQMTLATGALDNSFTIACVLNAFVFGAHAAFGVFAIGLLRQQP